MLFIFLPYMLFIVTHTSLKKKKKKWLLFNYVYLLICYLHRSNASRDIFHLTLTTCDRYKYYLHINLKLIFAYNFLSATFF